MTRWWPFILKSRHAAEMAALRPEYTSSFFHWQRAEAKISSLQNDIEVLTAELDHWRQYGQLRDPKTGRLIPRLANEARREKARGKVS